MPVNAAELMVKIGGDTSDLTSKVNEADSTLGKLGGTLGTVAKVGLGGMVVAAGGLAVGLTSSIGKAQDFEQSLSGIQAVSGATSDQMQMIADKALQIGKDTSFSATEGADAIAELVKAGISIPDVMNGAADAVVALAAAAGVGVPEAATIASNAMNQFHIAAKDLPGVVNNIAGAANASAIDVSQFGMSMSAVGAVANLAGLSFQETATAIAEMGNAGIVGSDAGTSLKSFLQSLVPTAKPAIAAMQELGLMTKDGANQFYDAQGKLKSMADIQALLQASTKNLTAEQKQMYLTTIFGSDGIRAAAIMADQGSEGFNKLAAAMNAVSASDVAAVRMGNTKGSMEALKGSIETLQITIGRALLPGIKAGTDGMITFVNALIPIATRAMPMIVAAITTAKAAISAFVTQGVAVALPYLQRFGAWFMTDGIVHIQQFAAQVQSLFVAALPHIQQFAAAFVTNVIPALVRLGQAFQDAFVRMLPTIRDQLLPALAKFGQMLVTDIIPALANLASFIVANVIPVMVDFYAKYITALVAAIGGLASFITGTVIPAVQAFATFFQANVLPVIQAVSGAITTVAVPAFQAVASFITGTVVPAVQQFAGIISTNLGPVIQAMVGWFQSDAMPVLTQFAGFINTTVIPVLRSFGDFLKTFVLPAVQAVIGFIADNWPHIRDIIVPVLEAIVLAVRTNWDLIHNAIDAALTLIKTMVQLAWDLISTTIDNALNIIRGFLTIFVGLFTGDWQKAWDGVKLIASSVWDEIKEVIRVAIEAVHTVLTTTLGLIEDTITSAWNLIKGIFGDAWNAAGGIVQLVGDGIQAVWDGMKNKLEDIRDNVVTPIWDGIKKIFEDGKTAIKDAIMWPFEQARDAIGGIMDHFKSNMAGPFNTAAGGIEDFIKGIAGAINWVAGKLNLGSIIDTGGVSIPRFARGGVTPGGPIFAGEQGVEMIMPPAGSRVFSAQETIDIFRAINGRGPEGRIGDPMGNGIGLGGSPWDWAKDKVKGAEEAIASTIRDWVAKGAAAMLSAAMDAVGIPSPGGAGVLGQIGAGIVPYVKDAAIQGIQALMDAIKDSIPKPPQAGGDPTGPLPQGSAIVDQAALTYGKRGWCEAFVGDVYNAVGLQYFRAENALAHSGMQALAPGLGPIGAAVYFPYDNVGDVAISLGDGRVFGTEGNGPRGAGPFWPGSPLGYTTHPAYGGRMFDEPVWGIGASGTRYSMAEDDAEILLNRGQASRAADALRGGSGDVIFQPGSVVIQGVRNLDDITDAQLERFMGRAGKVAKRKQILSGGSTI